jgi:PAS domain S-box-containing protein
MFIGWYGGVKPGLLAMVLSLPVFKYYFANPIHSLTVITREIPRLLIVSLALVSPSVVAQTAVEKPRTIRVVMDNAYAPYSFQSDERKLKGILIDQWQAWEKKTGFKAEIHAMDWDEALRRMRAGEFDVIDSIVETAERRDNFDFTPGYATVEASIFFRNDISGISDLASLKGFPVGVKAGDQHVDQLKTNAVTTVIVFQNNDAIIEAAKQHKINVFLIDDLSALYLLNKMGIEDEFRHSAPIFRDELRRAVRKGDAALLQTVSEGFATIEPGELKQIDEKWFGRTITRHRRYLTYSGYAAAVAILLIAGLVGWNRTLKKRILQRAAALRETEQRFRQIAENIREVFWLTTVDSSKTLYISPAYEAVWGRSCESLYQDPRSFISSIHPDDNARVVELLERDLEQDFEVEYRIVRPDGSIRWIRDRAFPIKDESGRFYRVAGLAEDITERKQGEDALRRSEDRIRLIIDTIPTMAWSLRPDAVLDFLNQRWLDYTGLSSEEAIEEPTRTVHPEDLARVMEKWLAVKATSEAYEDEMRLQRADGEYRWFLVRIAPLLDEQGNLLKRYGVAIDIEERKQAEEKLKATSKQLRALSARLQSAREEEGTRIAREIHDELGSALTSLKWDIERMENILSDPKPGPELESLKKKAQTMTRLVESTIDVVRRISAELRPGVLDDLGLAPAIEWQARLFQDRTGIPVHCDCPQDDLDLNQEQSTAVFRIFQEALTNILRHSQATRVDVTMVEKGDVFILTIGDNGRGITEDQKSGPSSIGLLGMRERAHLIGGEIEITGIEREGTMVTVRVPLLAPGVHSETRN